MSFCLNFWVGLNSQGKSYDQAHLGSASAGVSLQGAGSDETAETTAALNNASKGAHNSKAPDSMAPDNKAPHDPAPSGMVT